FRRLRAVRARDNAAEPRADRTVRTRDRVAEINEPRLVHGDTTGRGKQRAEAVTRTVDMLAGVAMRALARTGEQRAEIERVGGMIACAALPQAFHVADRLAEGAQPHERDARP